MSNIKKEVANATRWSTLTEFAAKCVTPLVNMVLARVLTPEAFGIVATVSVVVSFAEMFTDAGFQKYLMQHDFESQKELDDHTNVAFVSNFSLSILLWIIIFAFDDALANMLGCPGMGHVITVAAASIPLASFSSIQMARFKRDLEFKKLFFVRLVAICVPMLVTVPLALLLKSYWALIIGTLVTNCTNAVVLTIVSKWKPRVFFRFSILKEMFSYSWWILLESVLTWLTSYIGTFIVGVFLSSYYVGLYKTSMSTVNQIINLISAATSAPLFVALSRLKHEHEKMMDTYCHFIQCISVFMIPLGVGIWLYSDTVTQILLGSQWKEASGFIGLWGLTSSITLVLGTYCNGLYNAKGKTYLSFATQALHLIVLVPVLLVFSRKGFEALYIARSTVRLQLIVVQLITMKIFFKLKILELIKGMLPAIFSTAVMTVTSLLLQQVSDTIIWELCSIVICVILYFACFMMFWKDKLYQALELFEIKVRTVKNDASKVDD